MEFPHLFSPLRVGSIELKNRIVVAPHGTNMAKNGIITDEYISYAIERARGGAGLLIMSYGHTVPSAASSLLADLLVDTWRRENLDGFRTIVDSAHRDECCVFFQFGDSTRRTGLAPTAVTYPSVPGYRGGVAAAEMTRDDIRRMQARYVECALLLQEAGLDGIELHGHGDLLSDFLSPTMNRRSDEYGGSLANRMRYLVEALEEVRKAVGPDLVVGHRLSPNDELPGSIRLEEGVKIAARLAAEGTLDYLSISHSVEPQILDELIPPLYVEPGYAVGDARAIRAEVKGLPILVTGRITSPALAESVVASGAADLVGMARALIADPEWANKAREGRPEDIRPCLGDNQDCFGSIHFRLPMRCTVNPMVGREAEWGAGRFEAAVSPRAVVVVGGGPAGMEAASVAAMRGHQVRLFERDDRLGGQVLLAERLGGRSDLGAIVPWQERQLDRYGVEVVLGQEVTADATPALGADVLVLATGAVWPKTGFNGQDFTEVAGWEQPHVYGLQEALRRVPELSGRIVIYDQRGFVQAAGLAERLASQGHEVHIVTPFTVLGGPGLDETLQRRHIARRLGTTPVYLESRVTGVAGETVMIESSLTGVASTITAVDAVVVVGWPVADRSIDDLRPPAVSEIHRIGDCASPATIGEAIRAGHQVGRTI